MKRKFCFAMLCTLAIIFLGCSGGGNGYVPGPIPGPDIPTTAIVTFLGNEGTPGVTEITVPLGQRVTPPANPSRDGWTFVGWFMHQTEGILPVNFDRLIWDDLTLWARWSQDPFRVTFDLQGGEWEQEKDYVYVAAHHAVARPLYEPSKDKAVFIDWFAHPTEGNTPWNFASPITQDMTLYARWDNYIRVTFNLQGGEWTQDVLEKEDEYLYIIYIPPRTIVVRPSIVPSRFRHDFIDWFDAATGGNEWDFEAAITQSSTIYANWCAHVRFTMDAQGGAWTAGDWAQVQYRYVSVGTVIPRPATQPTQTGYIFINYFDAAAGGTEWDFTREIHTATTVFVQWTNTAVITFGAVGGVTPATQYVPVGTPAARPTGAFDRDGHVDGQRREGLFLAPADKWDWAVEWYRGPARWDFSQAVTDHIHFEGQWSTPYGPRRLPVLTPAQFNIFIHRAFWYIGDFPGHYYLFLEQDHTPVQANWGAAVGVAGDFIAGANTRLTIEGIGQERTIFRAYHGSNVPASMGRLFVVANGAELVLGNNITLSGSPGSNANSSLVQVIGSAGAGWGSLVMLPGSRITGMSQNFTPATGQTSGAVGLSAGNNRFTMYGGEIAGNDGPNWINSAAGLVASAGNIINLHGGRIADNYLEPAAPGGVTDRTRGLHDIAIGHNTGTAVAQVATINISDDFEFGDIVFNANSATLRASPLTIDPNWTGSGGRISLFGNNAALATVRTWWHQQPVLAATGLTSALVDRFQTHILWASGGLNSLVSDSHEIARDGANIGRLVHFAPIITTPAGPITQGVYGEAYSFALAARGVSVTWTLESGNLPDGLTLAGTGVISGTPTAKGNFTFTARATNPIGHSEAAFSIYIADADSGRSFRGFKAPAVQNNMPRLDFGAAPPVVEPADSALPLRRERR